MPQTFLDVPCTVCGCVCDDLQVTFSGERVTHAEGACKLAQPWFDSLAQPVTRPAAIIDRRSTSLEHAVERAAEILRDSRAPLIWGLSRSSTAGQRAAVLLAEQIGATIDTTASVCHGPSIMAIQQVGESTSSLGEVRNRADFVVFWGADPAETHPRHFERYSVDAAGLFVPRGRMDRTVIVIDSDETATSRLADVFLKIRPDADFEVIWALRQLLRGIDLPASFDVGVSAEQLQELAVRMSGCRYGAVFFGLGLAQRGIGHKNVEALLSLVDDLNDHTRFIARRLRIPGDVTGADAVLCWLTGFPFAVNLRAAFHATTQANIPRTNCWSAAKSTPACWSAVNRASIYHRVLKAKSSNCRQSPSIIPTPARRSKQRFKSQRRFTAYTRAARRTAWTRCRFPFANLFPRLYRRMMKCSWRFSSAWLKQHETAAGFQ